MAKGNGSNPDMQEALFDMGDEEEAAADKDAGTSAGPEANEESDRVVDSPPAKNASATEAAPPSADTPENGASNGASVSADASVDEASDEEPPEEIGPQVVELGNNAEGAWKVMDSGERVALDEAEWRQELTHQFSRQKPEQAAEAEEV